MMISVVVPVFNGERTLRLLTCAINDFFVTLKYPYEIILVWDCGFDRSWQVIEELKAEQPGIIKAVRLGRNFGQHNAIIAGFREAKGDFIITMDEDLQHNPQDIKLLLNKQAEKDYDVVYGKYRINRHNGYRKITSNVLKKLIEIGVPSVNRDYSPYRLIKSKVAKETLNMSNSYTFLDGYLSWITDSFGSCPVSHSERVAGESSYTTGKLIRHAWNIFITFSDLPLGIVKFSSFTFLAFSVIFALMTLLKKLTNSTLLPGYASTIILISTGFGLVLLALSVIGDYIHRINQKTTRRPNFIIKEIL